MLDELKSFHFSDFTNLIPHSLLLILITLALSFLIGLEREEHIEGNYYNFGGVCTFPIIGLCGYLMAKLTEETPIMIGLGVLVLGSLLWLSYRKKLELSSTAGMTSEISGLFTFLLGSLISHDALWEATTLSVLVLLLLELKTKLETLAHKIPPEEIFTFTRFLLISAVILPIIPNHDFTDLNFNPFRTWLIVVAFSCLSYGAYVMGRVLGTKKSIVFTAILGGIYSSTSTTVVLSKCSHGEKESALFSGSIVIASGFMYFRLIVLLYIFNASLGRRLIIPFIILGFNFIIIGGLWIIYGKQKGSTYIHDVQITKRNPLELQSALVFAILFSAMSILTIRVFQYLGAIGIYGLAFLSGLTDVDPFVMSLTQSLGAMAVQQTVANGIIIATASNNLMKGIYTAIFGNNTVRKQCAIILIILALISLFALIF